jgi:hypothetical protein
MNTVTRSCSSGCTAAFYAPKPELRRATHVHCSGWLRVRFPPRLAAAVIEVGRRALAFGTAPAARRARVGRGRRRFPPPPAFPLGPLDDESPFRQVDIGPLQRLDFAASQSGISTQKNHEMLLRAHDLPRFDEALVRGEVVERRHWGVKMPESRPLATEVARHRAFLKTLDAGRFSCS